MTKLVNPYPIFLDGQGDLIDAGYIYIGVANSNPETVGNRLNLFYDSALTQPALQPLRTLGGLIVNGQNPVLIYMAETDYSETIKSADSVLVSYTPSVAATGGATINYQPLD